VQSSAKSSTGCLHSTQTFKGRNEMNATYNTMTVEDVINTVDAQYRLSPYLKLRGHISYKAAKLAGMFLTSLTKKMLDNRSEHGLDHIDSFNAMAEYMRGESIEIELLESAGMEAQADMYDTLKGLIGYANKLNFDMQDMVDEGGTKRLKPGFKVRGVAFTEGEVVDSWYNSVRLLADPQDAFDTETYAEYASRVTDAEWQLTEAEWVAAQAQDDSVYKTREHDIVGLILGFGQEEIMFDELSERTQIAAIENMRGKIGKCIESALKSLRYNNQLDRAGKIAEASKLKGIINAWDGEFCKMLDSSRYANFAEFMYSYTPTREIAGRANAPVGRRIVARAEKPSSVRISDCAAREANGEEVTAEERAAERAAERLAVEEAKQAEREKLDAQRSKRSNVEQLEDILDMESDELN
jgi:hypothetical protein